MKIQLGPSPGTAVTLDGVSGYVVVTSGPRLTVVRGQGQTITVNTERLLRRAE